MAFKSETITANYSIINLTILAIMCATTVQADFNSSRHDHSVKMDDGIELNTTVFIPNASTPEHGWPAVIFMHGNGGAKNVGYAGPFASNGYATMAYTVRGGGQTYPDRKSDGVSSMAGSRELADFKAMIAWLNATYPVNSRRIGVTGPSLGGIHSWMGILPDIGIAATVPQNFAASSTEAMVHNGSIHPNFVRVPLSKSTPLDPALHARIKSIMMEYNTQGVRDYMATRGEFSANLWDTNVPVMIQNAWEDHWGTQTSLVHSFTALKGPKKLYLGTGGHGSENVDAEATFRANWTRRWFDRWLAEKENGIDMEPAVEIALLDTWEHMHFETFPPSDSKMQTLYLKTANRIGQLSESLPETPAVQTLTHQPDPSLTLAMIAEGIPLRPKGVLARIPLSSLTYQTEPLISSRLVVGIPKFQLYVTGSASRYQVNVRLWDIDEASDSRRMFSRATYLVSSKDQNERNAISSEMSAIGYRIPAGHRIEVEISNLDLDWSKTENDWYRVRSIPFLEPGEIQLHSTADRPAWVQIPFLSPSTTQH